MAGSESGCRCGQRVSELRTGRNPLLLLLLAGSLLLRLATRQLLALLFQLPPRFTRFEPYVQNPINFAMFFYFHFMPRS